MFKGWFQEYIIDLHISSCVMNVYISHINWNFYKWNNIVSSLYVISLRLLKNLKIVKEIEGQSSNVSMKWER